MFDSRRHTEESKTIIELSNSYIREHFNNYQYYGYNYKKKKLLTPMSSIGNPETSIHIWDRIICNITTMKQHYYISLENAGSVPTSNGEATIISLLINLIYRFDTVIVGSISYLHPTLLMTKRLIDYYDIIDNILNMEPPLDVERYELYRSFVRSYKSGVKIINNRSSKKIYG